MKKIIYITLTLCTLLAYSCKKRELPPENTDDAGAPVFYVKAEVNGFPLKFEAGSNDYYMNSSYYQDSVTNVYVYKADLRQKACSNGCGYGLTLLINDYQASPPGSVMNVDQGIKNGTYIFNDHDLSPLYYDAKFTPVDPKLNDASYSWVFSDGIVLNGYEVSRQFDAHKQYTARLSYSKDCSANHLNRFDVGSRLQTTVQAVRDMSLVETLTYQFSSTTMGEGPFKYTWDFGDSTGLSGESNPKHRYMSPGRYIARLQLIDANNDTCISYYQVSASFQKDCAANYVAAFTPVKNILGFSAITVLITDPAGMVYSSKDGVQPENSNFEIVSIENYKQNERNEPTKKIKIRFNCTLKSGGSNIVLKNGEAIMAVSYK